MGWYYLYTPKSPKKNPRWEFRVILLTLKNVCIFISLNTRRTVPHTAGTVDRSSPGIPAPSALMTNEKPGLVHSLFHFLSWTAHRRRPHQQPPEKVRHLAPSKVRQQVSAGFLGKHLGEHVLELPKLRDSRVRSIFDFDPQPFRKNLRIPHNSEGF